MPRNGSGVYSKPAGTTAVPNTVIESAKYNQLLDDIAADLNTARPIVAGGTGATSAATARTSLGFSADAGNFGVKGADIASAATTDLSAATGDYVTITGTTTITALGTSPAGTRRFVRFAGILTLTYNATSLILPTAANITTAAGDTAIFISEGAGNWRCVDYERASGLPVAQPAQPGLLFGLTLSNNVTDAVNDIDVATGSASSDSASPTVITLASSLTKRLDATWAVGTNQGGLDTGSIANATYHVWLIQRSDTGVVDALFSLSATSPTMPSNYDRKRRIGSIIRKSATILAFTQTRNVFTLSVPQNDYSTPNPGTSAVLATLTTPSGIKARAQIWFFLQTATATRRAVLVTSPDQADTVPTAGTASTLVTGFSSVTGASQGELMVRTNTSSQIRFRFDGSDANLSVFINTTGWIDDQL